MKTPARGGRQSGAAEGLGLPGVFYLRHPPEVNKRFFSWKVD
jgi:hypothetical protein